MIDPTDPATATEFDVDNPIVLDRAGKKIRAYRITAGTGFGSPAQPRARLIVSVDDEPFPIGSIEQADTRESVRKKAEQWVVQWLSKRNAE